MEPNLLYLKIYVQATSVAPFSLFSIEIDVLASALIHSILFPFSHLPFLDFPLAKISSPTPCC